MTKTYTIPKWAYTTWQDQNEIWKVPSRTWLLAFMYMKRDSVYIKQSQPWYLYLDDATHGMCLMDPTYIDQSTINYGCPFGRIDRAYWDKDYVD